MLSLNPKVIILILFLTGVLLLVILMLLLRQGGGSSIQPSLDIPFFQNDTSKPSPTPLQSQYQNYKEAVSQPFFHADENKTGILIVESNPEQARVLIDSSEEEVDQNSPTIPVNTTPFKVTQIPIGDHHLSAFKQGYIIKELNFTVKENEVTIINIDLVPLDGSVGY